MKRTPLFVLAFGMLLLFLIQLTGSLVQSIYILDLMHTSLDAKALGLLFFFTPGLLLLLRRKLAPQLAWVLGGLLFLARGVLPSLDTFWRMLASGVGTGAALLLLTLLLTARPKGDPALQTGRRVSAGLALAVGLSVLLRSLNFSIDYSLTPAGAWIGWGLGLVLLLLLSQLEWAADPAPRKKTRGLTAALLGIFLILTLVYFAFSAPAVLARWTEGNYALIVLTVSVLAAGWAWLSIAHPHSLERLSPPVVLFWNLAFSLCLVGTLLVQRVPFPQAPESPAVVVAGPSWLAQLLLALMLLLFPVLFLDLGLLVNRVRQHDPAPRDLVAGMLLGSLALVLLVFINIFTNVWGYIPPVSSLFRNMFWLPFLLIAGGISLLVGNQLGPEADPAPGAGIPWGWSVLLGLVVVGTGLGVLRGGRLQPEAADQSSLLVMTYNLQAGNDGAGESSFDRQLAVIRQVSPDVLALQESDTARISLNNNDLVRYFASQLGYYSYYGPSPVAGTFGTAILSKYPLLDTHTVFSYSDTDEIGTAVAHINVGGRSIIIYDVHPDGSDTAKLAWAATLLVQAQGQPNVLILGDFNLRENQAAYQRVAAVYTEAWASVYPSRIGPDGSDMTGRIDHIFITPALQVRNPLYLPPPASASDHPVHWAEIFWK